LTLGTVDKFGEMSASASVCVWVYAPQIRPSTFSAIFDWHWHWHWHCVCVYVRWKSGIPATS